MAMLGFHGIDTRFVMRLERIHACLQVDSRRSARCIAVWGYDVADCIDARGAIGRMSARSWRVWACLHVIAVLFFACMRVCAALFEPPAILSNKAFESFVNAHAISCTKVRFRPW